MKRPLDIGAKIWLSLGVLIIGYFITMAVGFFLGRANEIRLRHTAVYLFPAAKMSHSATVVAVGLVVRNGCEDCGTPSL